MLRVLLGEDVTDTGLAKYINKTEANLSFNFKKYKFSKFRDLEVHILAEKMTRVVSNKDDNITVFYGMSSCACIPTTLHTTIPAQVADICAN